MGLKKYEAFYTFFLCPERVDNGYQRELYSIGEKFQVSTEQLK